MKSKNEIGFAQFERRINPIRKNIEYFKVRNGWINYLRNVLDLRLSTLAKLAKTTSSTVQQAENREALGKVSLETLRKMAKAMDCELVYAFVPKKELKSLLKEKALKKARTIVSRADSHMDLENQKVKGDLEERVKRLANVLLESGDVW